MSKFLHDDDDAKAIAIPLVFSENSRVKNERQSNKFDIINTH